MLLQLIFYFQILVFRKDFISYKIHIYNYEVCKSSKYYLLVLLVSNTFIIFLKYGFKIVLL